MISMPFWLLLKKYVNGSKMHHVALFIGFHAIKMFGLASFNAILSDFCYKALIALLRSSILRNRDESGLLLLPHY